MKPKILSKLHNFLSPYHLITLSPPFFLFLFLFSLLYPLASILYSQSQTELGAEDDLTVLGTDGVWSDSDVEIKGFSIFGSTAGLTPQIESGPGNLVVRGKVQISSYAYFGSSITVNSFGYFGDTVTAAGYGVFLSTVQITEGNLKYGSGAAGKVMKSAGAGFVYWADDSIGAGDNLGNHVATTTLNMAGFDIVNVDTITAYAQGIYLGTHVFVTQGNVGIGTTAPAQKLHVEGLCVAGDTLLPIVLSKENSTQPFSDENREISYVRIDQVKGGEYVLSLNEKTGKIVPAKIKALLDMGIKPVYKLTTASGRKIRTTGNHPYLTRSGWRRVIEISAGEEIAAPRTLYVNSTYPVSPITKSRPDKFLPETDSRKEDSAGAMAAYRGGWMSTWMMPGVREARNLTASVKSASRVTMTLLSCIANRITAPFLKPAGTLFASWPSLLNSRMTLTSIFSSTRICMSELEKGDVPAVLNSFAGEPQRGLDVPTGYYRIAGAYFAQRGSCFKQFENISHHDAGSFKTRFAMANFGVDRNVILPVKRSAHLKNSIPGIPNYVKKTDGDILWDRVISIEFYGKEQVYDIEVEGTHNFVANGILAHNTYISGNVGIGTTGPATKLHISDPSASSGPSIRSSAAGGSANNKHWEIRNGSVDVAWG
ncbi:MAG: hypothetical protein HY746_09855, partial [Elusimicrobia bacterium]|nr:hypothetical protein [Elusimicrobiota bacterium]